MAQRAIQYADDEVELLEATLISDISDARAHFAEPLRMIERWREFYNPDRQVDEDDLPWHKAWAGHNPFVNTSTTTLMRKITAACFPDPQFHFEYPQHQIEDACEANMQAILKSSEYQRVFTEQVYEGLVAGFNVKWLRWDTQKEYRTRPRWTESGFDESERLETVYDLPRYEVIKPENLVVIPAHDADLQESEAVGHRFEVYGWQLDAGINSGLFDREAALHVMSQTTGHEYETTFEDDRWHVHPQEPYDGSERDWRYRTYTLTMLHKLLIQQAGKAGRQYVIILSEDNQRILRCAPAKTVTGLKPYSNFRPFTRARGIFGDSISSNGGAYTEDVLTLMGRFLVWSTQLGIDPVMLVGQRFHEAFKKDGYNIKEFRHPGAAMPVDDELLKEGGLKPFLPMGLNPQILIAAMEHFAEVGMQSTGASKNDSGERIPGATATEVAQIAAARQTLDGFIIEEAARTQDEDAKIIHGMVQQHYESESVKGIWQRINGKRVISIPVPGAAMQLAQQMPPGTMEQLLTKRLLASIAHPDKYDFPPKMQQAPPQPQPQALPAPGQPPTMPQGQPGQPQPPSQQAPAPLPPHIVNIPIPIEVIHADFEITSNAGPEQGDRFTRAQKAWARVERMAADPIFNALPAKYQYELKCAAFKEDGVQNPEDYLGTVDEYEKAKDDQAKSAMQMMQMEIEAKHGGQQQKQQNDPQAEQAKQEHEQQLKEAELALKAKIEAEKNKTALIRIAADHANNIQQAAQQADAAEHSQAMDFTNAALKAHDQQHGQAMAEHGATQSQQAQEHGQQMAEQGASEASDQQDFSQAQQTQSAEQAAQAQQFSQQQAVQQADVQKQQTGKGKQK